VDYYDEVRKFHAAAGQPSGSAIANLSDARMALRVSLIEEEFAEFVDASGFQERVHELTDLLYVIIGTFVEMGVHPDIPFSVVSKANLDKVSGGVFMDSQGKISKPKGFISPGRAVRQALDSMCSFVTGRDFRDGVSRGLFVRFLIGSAVLVIDQDCQFLSIEEATVGYLVARLVYDRDVALMVRAARGALVPLTLEPETAASLAGESGVSLCSTCGLFYGSEEGKVFAAQLNKLISLPIEKDVVNDFVMYIKNYGILDGEKGVCDCELD